MKRSCMDSRKLNINRKTPVLESLFNQVAGPQSVANLITQLFILIFAKISVIQAVRTESFISRKLIRLLLGFDDR